LVYDGTKIALFEKHGEIYLCNDICGRFDETTVLESVHAKTVALIKSHPHIIATCHKMAVQPRRIYAGAAVYGPYYHFLFSDN